MSSTTFPASNGKVAQPYEQVFTSSGTWTKPSGVTQVEVEMISGAGGSGTNAAGAGGYYKGIVPVTGNVAITVGAGGAAGTKGGDSIFGNAIKCVGSQPSTVNFNSGYVVKLNEPGFSNAMVAESYAMSYLPYGTWNTYQESNFGFPWAQNTGRWGYGLSWTGPTFGLSTSYTGKIQSVSIAGIQFHAATIVNHGSANYYGGYIIITSDNGASSVTRDCGVAYINGFASDGSAFYVSQISSSTLRKSVDGGATWSDLATNLPTGSSYTLVAVGTRLYALRYSGTTTTSVYTSTDGASWTAVSVSFTPSQSSTSGHDRQCYTDGTSLYFHNNGSTGGIVKITGTSASTLSASLGISNGSYSSYGVNQRFARTGNDLIDMTTGNIVNVNFFNTYSSYYPTHFGNSMFMGFNGGMSYGPTQYSVYAGYPAHTGVNGASAGAIGPLTYNSGGQTAAGPGTALGWGHGGNNSYQNTSFGSGKLSSPGNAGIVIVRWWA